jgi:hypothetical protein
MVVAVRRRVPLLAFFAVLLLCGTPGLIVLLVATIGSDPFLLPMHPECWQRARLHLALGLVTAFVAVLVPGVAIVALGDSVPWIFPKALATGAVLLAFPVFFLYLSPHRGPRAITSRGTIIDIPNADAAAAIASEWPEQP